MICYCDQCGNYHESVTACGRSVQIPAPLPPTAEQTSIARFNALADQIRELEKSLKERQDQDREAISSWISLCELELSAKLDRALEPYSKDYWTGYNDGCKDVRENLATKSRAVAKKKAAPLVGKKGTGRKG